MVAPVAPVVPVVQVARRVLLAAVPDRSAPKALVGMAVTPAVARRAATVVPVSMVCHRRRFIGLALRAAVVVMPVSGVPVASVGSLVPKVWAAMAVTVVAAVTAAR